MTSSNTRPFIPNLHNLDRSVVDVRKEMKLQSANSTRLPERSPYSVKNLNKGTLYFSSPSFSPYNRPVYARELNVISTNDNSPKDLQDHLGYSRLKFSGEDLNSPKGFPLPMSESLSTQGNHIVTVFRKTPNSKQTVITESCQSKQARPKVKIILSKQNDNWPLTVPGTVMKTVESDDQALLSFPNKLSRNLKQTIKSNMVLTVDNSDISTLPEELAHVMRQMPSPIKAIPGNKIVLKNTLKQITGKIDKTKKTVRKNVNKNKNSKSLTSVDSTPANKDSMKPGIDSPTRRASDVQLSKTVKMSKLKTQNVKRTKPAKRNSTTQLATRTQPWQKYSKIIQILSVPGQTKYKMCDIPVFFMNGTIEKLLPAEADETPCFVLCTQDDSIIAVMLNVIRPDQYLITFTDEFYKIKSSKSKQSEDKRVEFTLRKAIFTTYLGSITPPSVGGHIVVFGQFIDGTISESTDVRAPDVNTQQLAKIISDVQLSWPDEDSFVTDPRTKPKCDHPIYKAMTRILSSKRKTDNETVTPESEKKPKKLKFQLKVIYKNTDKPLLKDRSKTKVKRRRKGNVSKENEDGQKYESKVPTLNENNTAQEN